MVQTKMADYGKMGFEDNFNPSPIVKTQAVVTLKPPVLNENTGEQSQKYLVSLEAKLDRMKRKPGKLNSKEILKSLHQTKEDAMTRFITQDASVVDDADISDTSDVTTISDLKRRMFPEQPLTSEEIQCLLERDYLRQEEETEDKISTIGTGGSST